MTDEQTRALILDVLGTVRPVQSADRNAVIFGDGEMDSMSLVIFIAELEARIAEATGTNLVLASDRAMSRSESPYRTVDALTQFVQELLAESRAR